MFFVADGSLPDDGVNVHAGRSFSYEGPNGRYLHVRNSLMNYGLNVYVISTIDSVLNSINVSAN